jgi:hypothetical protein
MLQTISERVAELIAEGEKFFGTFEKGYVHVTQRVVIMGPGVFNFCKWLDENRHLESEEVPFSESNFTNLFKNHFSRNRSFGV